MLKLSNLSKIYRTDEVETVALNSVDIDIDRGEFVAIMGPSGDYFFDGENVAGYGENRLSDIRKRNIGFIFQSFNLIDELSVQENIELALLYHDIPAAQRRERVADVMDRVGIAHRARHMPSQLSGGQQQRVAVARAVVGEQPLILADEPTGNLDSAHGQEVMEMLQKLNEGGTTVVMVTHSAAHSDYARRIINLLDGHVLTENLRAVG